jgi:hypothetical protein
MNEFRTILRINNINQLIIVMVKCGVLFEVRTEFLNIICINNVLQSHWVVTEVAVTGLIHT